MSRVLFVTGTNTEVGKTAVTAAVAALAVRAGLRTAVLKPGQTGVAPGEPGTPRRWPDCSAARR